MWWGDGTVWKDSLDGVTVHCVSDNGAVVVHKGWYSGVINGGAVRG